MATGRGLSRGLALGLQAAKQFSDREEAEKDRQFRKDLADDQNQLAMQRMGMEAAWKSLDHAYRVAKDQNDDKRIRQLEKDRNDLSKWTAQLEAGTRLTGDAMRQVTAMAALGETTRANKAGEAETSRANMARETETKRANQAAEGDRDADRAVRENEESNANMRYLMSLQQEGNQFDRRQTEIEQAREAMDGFRQRQMEVQEASSAVGNNYTRAQTEALRQDTQNNAWSPEVRKVMDLRKLIEQAKREGQAIQDKYGMQILEEPDPFRQQALRDQMQMDLANHQQSTSRFVQMAENAIADGEKTGRTTYTSRWVPDTNGLGGKLVPQIQTGNLEDFKNFQKQYGSNTDQGNPLGLTKPPVTPQSPPRVIPTTPPPVDPRGKNLTPEPISPRSESPNRQNMLSVPLRRSQPSSSGPSLFDALWGTGKDKKKIY